MCKIGLPLLSILVLLAAGCGGATLRLPSAAKPADAVSVVCSRFEHELRKLIERESVGDAEGYPLSDFPYLRVNRFWASYSDSTEDPDSLEFWVSQLRNLGLDGREVEIGNLRPDVSLPGYSRVDLRRTAARCGDRSVRLDLANPERLLRLREQAKVPDDYSTFSRVIGLYPLSSQVMRAGAVRLQDEIRELYVEFQHRDEEGVVYFPPEGFRDLGDRVAGLLRGAEQRNPLGVPLLTAQERQVLLEAYAPVWEIGRASRADDPGRVLLGASGPEVDPRFPTVYGYVSHTRFYGAALAQLNYVIWFSERPPESRLDWYSGRFDGVVWRVTLDSDGYPLIYDSIHSCGCYHQLFPSYRLEAVAETDVFSEPILIPRRAPELLGGERVTLRIRAGDHFLVGVESTGGGRSDGRTYHLAGYDDLRRLSRESETRSLFRPDGILEGSERLERWLLWPAGIREPGAMRQRGRQPIAFVGRRHFDDAFLMESLFQRAD